LAGDVEALLARLVQQFSSPYDFLRELVQNSMDGGTDIVEVRLCTHRTDVEGDVVFEIAVVDAGEGMDEAIIDTELTRLFATSKREDDTKAGGFGVGFVSVFAWEPQCVLVQTGRRDEAWELVFGPDRAFEKHRVDGPLEGTTVRAFRRGHAAEREGIADAIRDALWRWCRYAPVELTFEDEAGGAGLELVADAPIPEDAAVVRDQRIGPTRIRLAFAVPPHAILLRHGLVLAEGNPGAHLTGVAPRLGDTLEHLRVWIDSPRLRTTISRDAVIDDEGRREIDHDVMRLVEEMRDELLDRAEEAAGGDEWTEHRLRHWSYLHHHLACEHSARPKAILERALLRSAAGTPVSVSGLTARARARVVAVVALAPADPEETVLRIAASRCGLPLLVASWSDDRGWLQGLLQRGGLHALPLRRAVTRLTTTEKDVPSLAESVLTVLRSRAPWIAALGFARFEDDDPRRPALVGVEAAEGVAVVGGPLPREWVQGQPVWINRIHPLVGRALAAGCPRPVGVFALACAVADRFADPRLAPESLTAALARTSPPR
jgi:hypothetical protein